MWYLLVALLSSDIISADDENWWKYTEIYEIFVPSYQDSDGDGIGDLKGITSRLDHIKDIGVDAIWLTPFYKSPMADSGYDISNFTDVEPRFGTLQDFDELIRELKKREIKIFIDCVINHSSEEHPWFQMSIKGIKPYDDYYVWKDPKGYNSTGHPIPPNNWLSLFGGSAWEWNEQRRQFYLHQFGKEQPDFNLRNPDVKMEMKKILKFWFDKGITGLRMDAIIQYIEDSELRDEPLLHPEIKKEEYTYQDYDHIYTTDNWETYEFAHELRQFTDEISKIDGGPERVIICEAYTNINNTMAFYGRRDYLIAHFPFNFWLVPPEKYRNASSTQKFIDYWIHNLPETGVPNWVVETHDAIRAATELQSEEFAHLLTFLIMTLPGVACLYYGQEIGMPAGPIRQDQVRDHLRGLDRSRISRDPLRTPMQWDGSLNSGFSSRSKTWLPVNPNYWRLNVAAQKSDSNSFLHVFKALSKLRKTRIGKYGNFDSYVLSNWVFAFTRQFENETNLVIINLGTETETITLNKELLSLPSNMKIFTGTPNSGYIKGSIVTISYESPGLILKPASCLLLTIDLKEISAQDFEKTTQYNIKRR